jgi:hypothetical protein
MLINFYHTLHCQNTGTLHFIRAVESILKYPTLTPTPRYSIILRFYDYIAQEGISKPEQLHESSGECLNPCPWRFEPNCCSYAIVVLLLFIVKEIKFIMLKKIHVGLWQNENSIRWNKKYKSISPKFIKLRTRVRAKWLNYDQKDKKFQT